MNGRLRWTLRLRLTALYTALFAAAGAALLAATYALVANRLPAASAGAQALKGGGLAQACKHVNYLSPSDLVLKCKAAYAAGLQAGRAQARGDALHSLLVYSVAGLLVATALVALLGWLVAGRALRPVRDMTETARDISAHDLDRRINLTGPRDELKELADTFDGMLGRLSDAFTAQQRFVANASHELRTPLTIIRTELEVTLAAPDPGVEEFRRMATVVSGAVARSERLIDALLTLAQSDHGLARRTPVRLDEIAGLSVAQLQPELDRRGITVTTALEATPIEGDELLLEQLVQNLLDNALRHNLDGGWLDVHTGNFGGAAMLAVSNSTTPHDADAAVAFEPFNRARNGAQQRGHGLGLSIVRSVATAHGGSVAAERADATFRVEVLIPPTGE
jgi:signal transduction histidine kinase